MMHGEQRPRRFRENDKLTTKLWRNKILLRDVKMYATTTIIFL